MSAIRRYEDIQAWQRAREVVREVYVVSRTEPFNRDFGLRDQICRAAVSAMSNIAEGFGRRSNKDFAHFLDISIGSAMEIQSLLYVALDLRYITQPTFDLMYGMTNEVVAMLTTFTSYLRNTPRSQP